VYGKIVLENDVREMGVWICGLDSSGSG
jgi:hypothetical protein